MADCKQIFAQLSEYLDGELPPQMCEEIRSHMADCPPCIEFLKSLGHAIDLIKQYEMEEKPGPLPSSVRQELLSTYEAMRQRTDASSSHCTDG